MSFVPGPKIGVISKPAKLLDVMRLDWYQFTSLIPMLMTAMKVIVPSLYPSLKKDWCCG